jgi:NAD+ kinase
MGDGALSVLVVHKRSNLESYTRRWGKQTAAQRRAINRVFAAAAKSHDATVDEVKSSLDWIGAKTVFMLRDDLKLFDERRYDLVVTVGGDGTLLATASQLERTPVLAVNSAPQSSVGFFAAASINDVRAWLERISRGAEKPHALHRMQVEHNGKSVGHPALNDALVSHPSPVMTTRLFLKPPGVKKGEEQKSSGVWISTPAGSSSAARAAGGVLLPLASKELQYVVREPYVSAGGEYEHTKGIIRPGQRLLVESRLPLGRVYIDGSAHEVHLGFGDKLAFSASKTPLLLYGHSPVMRAIHR